MLKSCQEIERNVIVDKDPEMALLVEAILDGVRMADFYAFDVLLNRALTSLQKMQFDPHSAGHIEYEFEEKHIAIFRGMIKERESFYQNLPKKLKRYLLKKVVLIRKTLEYKWALSCETHWLGNLDEGDHAHRIMEDWRASANQLNKRMRKIKKQLKDFLEQSQHPAHALN